MKEFIWVLAIISVVYFIKKYLVPYLVFKFMFWLMAIRIKRMAKRHGGEIGKQLKDISEQLRAVSKEEKL